MSSCDHNAPESFPYSLFFMEGLCPLSQSPGTLVLYAAFLNTRREAPRLLLHKYARLEFYFASSFVVSISTYSAQLYGLEQIKHQIAIRLCELM